MEEVFAGSELLQLLWYRLYFLTAFTYVYSGQRERGREGGREGERKSTYIQWWEKEMGGRGQKRRVGGAKIREGRGKGRKERGEWERKKRRVEEGDGRNVERSEQKEGYLCHQKTMVLNALLTQYKCRKYTTHVQNSTKAVHAYVHGVDEL